MKSNDLKIAWIVNAYRKPDQVIHIINRIMGVNDSVWLHYDKKSSKSEFNYIRKYYSSNPKVHCFSKYSIHWAGYEIILVDWFLGRELKRSEVQYDYVIHFTGSTYPIKTDSFLREFLKDNYGKTFINLDPNEAISDNGSDRSRHFAKEHFGIYPSRNIPKYKLLNSFRFRLNLKFLRLQYNIGLLKSNVKIPNAFPKIYRGFVHNVIFRDHYSSAIDNIKTIKFLKQLKFINAPDEVFFNTVLINTVNSKDIVVDDNLLLTFWRNSTASPDNINENDLETILKSTKFFARKIESDELLKTLDSHMQK